MSFLMEAFMYRFHPQIVWAIEQVNAGSIGPVRLVRASFSFDIRSHPDDIRLKPDLAGGSLMDVGCYTINACRAIYGHAASCCGRHVSIPRVQLVLIWRRMLFSTLARDALAL